MLHEANRYLLAVTFFGFLAAAHILPDLSVQGKNLTREAKILHPVYHRVDHTKCRKVPLGQAESLSRHSSQSDIFSGSSKKTAGQSQANIKVTKSRHALVKRRIDQENIYELIFSYSCPEDLEAYETFFLKIKYTRATGLVTFHNVLNVVNIGRVDQVQTLGQTTIDFEGFIGSFLRRHRESDWVGYQRVCVYKYRAYVEGEVYLREMSAFVGQATHGTSRFEPRVTEECFHSTVEDGMMEICPEGTEPSQCTVHSAVMSRAE